MSINDSVGDYKKKSCSTFFNRSACLKLKSYYNYYTYISKITIVIVNNINNITR